MESTTRRSREYGAAYNIDRPVGKETESVLQQAGGIAARVSLKGCAMTISSSRAASGRRRAWLLAAIWIATLSPVLLMLVLLQRCEAQRDEQLRLMDVEGGREILWWEFAPVNPGWTFDTWIAADSLTVGSSAEYRAERGPTWKSIFDRLNRVVLAEVQEGEGLRRLAKCASLEAIDADKVRFSRQGWDALAACRQVKFLDLTECSLDDFDLSLLGNLRRLKILHLSQTSTVDDRLNFLGDLKALEQLDLTGTRVAGRFLQEPGELPSLKGLVVIDTAFDDEGIRRVVASCPRLESFFAKGCAEVGAGAAALGLAPFLTTLDLRGTGVGDEVLVGIARSTSLRELSLNGTRITGKGLIALAKIPSLTNVSFDLESVSQQDWDEFVRQRPEVSITGKKPARYLRNRF